MCEKVKGRERQRDAKEGEKEERKKREKVCQRLCALVDQSKLGSRAV